MKKTIFILVILIIFFLAAFGLGYFIIQNSPKQSVSVPANVNNFSDCVAAGYPVMESYPRQCRTPDGRNFIEQIPESEIIAGIKSLQYINAEFGFSFQHPQSSEIRKENLEGYLSLTKIGLVGIFLPQDLFAGTNLGEAAVIVGVATSADLVSECEQANSLNGEQDLGQAIIGATPSHKFSAIGAAAGNTYGSTIYRLVRNQNCYEIVELLHWGNIYNYPQGAVQEFDQAKFSGILEKMAQTITFSPLPSGVSGSVSVGPTCPVEKTPPDPNCAPRPYQTTIDITGLNNFFQTIQTDPSGSFSVVLGPGSYILTAKGGNTLPRCSSQNVEITPNQFASVTITCDSGIR